MKERDRDMMTAEIQRRLKPFDIELGAVSIDGSDDWIAIRVETSKNGCVYESTSWHNSGYRTRWAEEIGRIHLTGHYDRGNI